MSTLPPTPATGLEAATAARRLALDGGNELPVAKRRSLFRLPCEVLRQPMFALLIAGGVVYLLLGKVLYESGDIQHFVYFPIDSIISLLYVMESGASAEISVVGNEGLIGIALFMGGESTTSRAIVQSAGAAYRLPGQRLKEEFNRHGVMQVLMLRYTQALITKMAQTAVCNRHHTIDQPLCRWLLLLLDRLPTNRLAMTQELIANMLGVRREGVTEAASKLQKLGVIEYTRGDIRVVDRAALETVACSCYDAIIREYRRVFPTTRRAASS